MRTLRLVPIAAAVILVVNLLAVSGADVRAAQGGGNELCVAISGGTVQNATVVDVAADGGTAIGDASGGSGNLAAITGNDNNNNGNNNNNNHDNNNHDNNRNNNNRNNNRNDWSAESLQSLEERLLQTETASAGNGGVATASADGGAVAIGDINSGGNVGNAIAVGDTVCAAAAPPKPAGGGGGNAAPSGGGGGGRGGQVRALPSTGVGELGDGTSGSLILALGALGLLGLSVGSRLERRAVQVGGR